MAGHHLRCHQCAPVEDKFSMEHALSYTKGEFPSIRHSEICNLTTTLLTEVCHGMCIEAGLPVVEKGVDITGPGGVTLSRLTVNS